MMIVQHNTSAMNIMKIQRWEWSGMAKNMEKLASGHQINRAADNAASLAISEKMRSQIRGLARASANCQDGISLIQTADGALSKTHSILQRIRELSVQAANDTYTTDDRMAVQEEINLLGEEIDRIAAETEFNKENLPLLGAEGSSTTSFVEPTPLSDADYTGSNVQVVNASNIANYASYTDSDGKLHYVLGSGTYQIAGLTNCVFDVSGRCNLENTNLTNAMINCAAGTTLSVKNVQIDNSGNTLAIGAGGNGIGSPINFNGQGNVLNSFGTNTFQGGMDNYRVFTYTSLYTTSFNVPCAAIHVASGDALTINGTATSSLRVASYRTHINWGHGSGPRQAYCIGGDFYERDGGRIIINSGHIEGLSTSYTAYTIGGGNNCELIINGGKIISQGIGGGDGLIINVPNPFVKVTINGGTINNTNYPIGCEYSGVVNINGGQTAVTNKFYEISQIHPILQFF